MMKMLFFIILGFSAGSALGQQQQAVATVTRKISADGPTCIFKLFPVDSFSNWHYRITVSSENDSHVLQDIVGIRNGINVGRYPNSFEILDLDQDGFADIRLLGGFDKSGRYAKAWYKVWLYQPETKSYVFKPANPPPASSGPKKESSPENVPAF